MNYSKYQTGIFDAYKQTESNLSIVAVAGSGKSTTLEALVEQIPWENSVLVVAFNKEIVADLTPRMRKHPMATVCTLNSFGYRILRGGPPLADLDDDKTDNALKKVLKQSGNDFYFWKWRYTIKRLIDLFRANLIVGPGSVVIDQTLDEYGIDPPYKENKRGLFIETVRDTYNQCLAWSHIPDYRDQVFMVSYLKLPIPQYDVVLVDEDQDLDKCQAELVCQAARRLVMVGDPDQAIYRFRGAMPDAVVKLEQRMQAKRLPLSVCYRCPRKVIARAKKLVPQIEPCDWAPEGVDEPIKLADFRRSVKDGAMVLCRCVKPLVSECLALIRLGRQAKVKGRDLGVQIKALIDKIATDGEMPIRQFGEELGVYYSTQLERLQKEDQIIALQDRVDTVRAIMESVSFVKELNPKIDSIFTDDPKARGIQLMTVHKAKGLEATHVYILAPELLPHPRAKTPEAIADENRLLYVAITRVKFTVTEPGSLFWIVP